MHLSSVQFDVMMSGCVLWSIVPTVQRCVCMHGSYMDAIIICAMRGHGAWMCVVECCTYRTCMHNSYMRAMIICAMICHCSWMCGLWSVILTTHRWVCVRGSYMSAMIIHAMICHCERLCVLVECHTYCTKVGLHVRKLYECTDHPCNERSWCADVCGSGFTHTAQRHVLMHGSCISASIIRFMRGEVAWMSICCV